MPTDEFHVKLFGLTGREIADYAGFAIPCPDCKADAGRKCPQQEGRSVCKGRFTAAVKRLAEVAETVVRQEIDWAQSWLSSQDEEIEIPAEPVKPVRRSLRPVPGDDPWAV